jgi:hypothetical protein
MDRRTALYRLFDRDDRLLYVGIAFNPRVRCYHHKKHKPWWSEVARREVEWHDDRRQAEAAERAAIAGEQPLYNVSGVADPLRVEAPPPPAKPPLDPTITEGLRHAARVNRRADRAAERARRALRETILEAARQGMGPAEITKAIGHAYTTAHVSRMIHGKA